MSMVHHAPNPVTRRTALGFLVSAPAVRVPARTGVQLASAARREIGVTRVYDGGYHSITYPGGDLPRSAGACTDVVIRAARDAWGVDLQRLVHEDMARHFGAYPPSGLTAPDANIDHRRVANLEVYFARRGARIWQAPHLGGPHQFPGPLEVGDLLTWRTFPRHGPHIAIVSQVGASSRVIQNHGWGVREDRLAGPWLDRPAGHFRWRP